MGNSLVAFFKGILVMQCKFKIHLLKYRLSNLGGKLVTNDPECREK